MALATFISVTSFGLPGCGVKIRPCVLDGTCVVPTPLPTPTATPTPQATPTPDPIPTPTPLSCPTDVEWGPKVSDVPTMTEIVDSSVAMVKAAHPELFTPSGGNLVDWPSDPTNPGGEHKMHQFYLLLQSTLFTQGVCSITQNGDVMDEIQVLTKEGTSEGYHIINLGGGGVGKASEAYKGTVSVRHHDPHPEPTVGPPSACPLPHPGPVTKVGIKVHAVGPNWTTIDTTEFHGPDADFCRLAGWTDGRKFCPVRPEGHPDLRVCTLAYESNPQFNVQWPHNPGEYRTNPDNGFQLQVRRGTQASVQACVDVYVCSERLMVQP